MSSKRIVDLAAARSLLFDASEGLVTAGRLLKSSGLTDDDRAAACFVGWAVAAWTR